MGRFFVDQYSLLHFSTGVISYFWQVPFILGLIIHVLFEIIENSAFGMALINDYFVNEGQLLRWPGGKYEADTFINSMGDNVFYSIGWFISYYLDLDYYAKGKYVRY